MSFSNTVCQQYFVDIKIFRYFVTVNFSQPFSDMTENNNEEELWNRICLETLEKFIDLLS